MRKLPTKRQWRSGRRTAESNGQKMRKVLVAEIQEKKKEAVDEEWRPRERKGDDEVSGRKGDRPTGGAVLEDDCNSEHDKVFRKKWRKEIN